MEKNHYVRALTLVDQALAETQGRQLVSAEEVQNRLLDIRNELALIDPLMEMVFGGTN